MQRIIFGITGLTLGGAERVLVDIANELVSKYDITIFTLYGKGELEKELSDKVKLVNMVDRSYNELTDREKLDISLKLLFNKKSIYKKYIAKGYDTEVAFLEGPATSIFSVKNKGVKKIAWVHNDIVQVFGKDIKAKVKKFLSKKYYSKYNDIVFVSEDNKEQFEELYKLNNNKLVITNYVSSKRVLEKADVPFINIFEKGQVNFLTVARLTDQKAIDRLIKVHSKLLDDGYKHRIYVIGDGPEKEKLNELIKKYNVGGSFRLLGKKENPYPFMKNCDVFALLSYYEGLPITVLESKVFNKPILITNTAAREAVTGYDKAYIVDNTDEGIYEGIKNSILMEQKSSNTPEQTYYEDYEIIKQIEKLVK